MNIFCYFQNHFCLIVTASSKFAYAPGTTYRYKYEGETITSMLGASEDHSTIGINAFVDIEVISKCEMVMQVRFRLW